MPVIRIPDELYERLQKHATPFVDTPATVIERLLNAFEASRLQGSTGQAEMVLAVEAQQDSPFTSNQYNTCSLIKWATVEGYSRDDTIKVCKLLLGEEPHPSTLGCQRSAGLKIKIGQKPTHHDGPVADVSREDAELVRSRIGEPTEV